MAQKRGRPLNYVWFTILICIFLSLAAQCFSADVIVKNIRLSEESFSEESSYPKIIKKYQGGQLDNFTDALILNIAGYKGDEGILKRMAANYRAVGPENNAYRDIRILFGKEEAVSVEEYARYWFGNLFFVKLSLMFFDYSDIQMWNQIVQIMLLSYLLFLFYKNGLGRFCLPLLTSILFLMPYTVALSLQFSSVYYIVLLSMILIVKSSNVFKETVAGSGYVAMFACIGIVTNWLDLLTYALLTLGMPLCLILVIAGERETDVEPGMILRIVFAWGMGYAGMWLMKWLLASVLLDRNVLAEAIDQIRFRSATQFRGIHLSRLEIIKNNIKVMVKSPYIILCITVCLYGVTSIYMRYKEKHIVKIRSLKTMCLFMSVALLPFVWYVLLPQHSSVHCWFTYRNMAVSVFAVFSYLYQMGTGGDMERRKTSQEDTERL